MKCKRGGRSLWRGKSYLKITEVFSQLQFLSKSLKTQRPVIAFFVVAHFLIQIVSSWQQGIAVLLSACPCLYGRSLCLSHRTNNSSYDPSAWVPRWRVLWWLKWTCPFTLLCKMENLTNQARRRMLTEGDCVKSKISWSKIFFLGIFK